MAAYLATGSGLTRKESESFARAFFEVIESGLLEDKFVKIKGFGTFKLIVVSERESVNVNTGERFQIGRHSKVSFTPEASLKELVNRPFAHFEAVDLNDDTDVAELNSVDDGMAEEAAEAEDALAATEWAEETASASEGAAAAEEKAKEENTLTVSGVPNSIEAESESEKETTETDENGAGIGSGEKKKDFDGTEKGSDKADKDSGEANNESVRIETDSDEIGTGSDEKDTDEVNEIRVSPPTPISRGEQATDEEPQASRPGATPPVPQDTANAQQEPSPVTQGTETMPQEPTTAAAPTETETATEKPQQDAAESLKAAQETLQATQKTQQDAQETLQAATQNSTQSASSGKRCLNAAGEGAVSISYTETPRPAGRNWWKTATLTICVLLLMALSYFAGYFQLLCPCTFLGREVPPPALPSLPQPVPAPESRTAPSHPSAAPAAPAQTSAPSADAPTPKEAKDAANGGKDAAANGKDAASNGKNAGDNGKSAAEAAEGKCAAAAPATPPSDNALPRTHKVKAGDNLSRLSRRYYGSDKHIDFIIKTNKLRDADNIPLGSTLTFPPLPQTGR